MPAANNWVLFRAKHLYFLQQMVLCFTIKLFISKHMIIYVGPAIRLPAMHVLLSQGQFLHLPLIPLLFIVHIINLCVVHTDLLCHSSPAIDHMTAILTCQTEVLSPLPLKNVFFFCCYFTVMFDLR